MQLENENVSAATAARIRSSSRSTVPFSSVCNRSSLCIPTVKKPAYNQSGQFYNEVRCNRAQVEALSMLIVILAKAIVRALEHYPQTTLSRFQNVLVQMYTHLSRHESKTAGFSCSLQVSTRNNPVDLVLGSLQGLGWHCMTAAPGRTRLVARRATVNFSSTSCQTCTCSVARVAQSVPHYCFQMRQFVALDRE